MKTYTLTEVAELLEADVKTLRRWIELEKFDLERQTSKYDKRIKWLSEDQVATLAKAHSKLWPPRPKSPAQAEAQVKGLPGIVNKLRDDVEQLQEDHVSLDQWKETVNDLYRRVGDLETKYTDLLLKHGDLLIKLNEQTQAQAKRPGRKPKVQGETQGED